MKKSIKKALIKVSVSSFIFFITCIGFGAILKGVVEYVDDTVNKE